LGLAGVRGGYLVTSDIFTEYYNKVSNPYVLNGIANYIAIAALNDIQFIDECKKKIKTAKTKLIDSLQKYTVLETDLHVPIMTIKHPDSKVDFMELLKNHNILAVSGEGFIGLDKSFARLRIPSDIDSLVNAFASM
jgi:histidinol-phosphate aminotransferase